MTTQPPFTSDFTNDKAREIQSPESENPSLNEEVSRLIQQARETRVQEFQAALKELMRFCIGEVKNIEAWELSKTKSFAGSNTHHIYSEGFIETEHLSVRVMAIVEQKKETINEKKESKEIFNEKYLNTRVCLADQKTRKIFLHAQYDNEKGYLWCYGPGMPSAEGLPNIEDKDIMGKHGPLLNHEAMGWVVPGLEEVLGFSLKSELHKAKEKIVSAPYQTQAENYLCAIVKSMHKSGVLSVGQPVENVETLITNVGPVVAKEALNMQKGAEETGINVADNFKKLVERLGLDGLKVQAQNESVPAIVQKEVEVLPSVGALRLK